MINIPHIPFGLIGPAVSKSSAGRELPYKIGAMPELSRCGRSGLGKRPPKRGQGLKISEEVLGKGEGGDGGGFSP